MGGALDFQERSDDETLVQAWRIYRPREDERYDLRNRAAIGILEALSTERPGDRSVERFAARACEPQDHPPGANWDAVNQFEEK